MKLFGVVLIVSIIIILCPVLTWSQQLPFSVNRSARAGTADANQTLDRLAMLRQDPAYRARETTMNQQILSYGSPLANSYTLPVVFHIISQNPASVTDATILAALQDLNNAFAKSGIYASGNGVNTQIQFCLAQQDPQGGNSSGITRTGSVLTNMDQDLEDEKLKNLVLWDPKRYINIWYVNDIQAELFARYSCGHWTRIKEAGYATMPPGGGPLDGIVVSAFGILLAHEMGHYLSLYHTFEGLNCENSNCATSGDMVCDTPPDASIDAAPSCTQPTNSCSSDTSSGFPVDVPDRIDNFMDYSNDACHNAFTEGQAVRMRAAIATQRSTLLQSVCNKPCAESSTASFTRSNPSPVPGDFITFTNTSSGATNYQWLVDGVVVSTGINLTQTFNANGKYQVTLKAFNANAACYATYSDDVIITCGTMARFYPDKRIIASKVPIFPDSVFFTNRSVNAAAYQWRMSSDAGMAEQTVSTGGDLNYVFADPGNYSIKLIASKGACADTSKIFHLQVLDPTPDGYVTLFSEKCLDQTKLTVRIRVCNNGYAPIPPNTPVNFYEHDPRVAGIDPVKLGPAFIVPDTVKGRCCGNTYDHVIDVKHPKLDTLYAVFNDNGTVLPLALPNTSLVELNYQNNLTIVKDFAYQVTVSPAVSTLIPGDTLHLTAAAGPNPTVSYTWSSPDKLSCTQCAQTTLIADSNTTKQVVAISDAACSDTAYAVVKVPPADDFTLTIDTVACEKNDSLRLRFTVCNSFNRGNIPVGLAVSFYDGNPNDAGSHLLGPVFMNPDAHTDSCVTFAQVIAGISGGTVFGVVNRIDQDTSLTIPEKDYSNNGSAYAYQPAVISIVPADTTVMKAQPFTLQISPAVRDYSSAVWSTGNGYTLSCTACSAPVVTPFTASAISVSYTDPNGCTLSAQSRFTTFAPGRVNIPNAFTPNQDGHNDVFYVLGGREVQMVRELSIFNRYGQHIFQLNNVPANDPAYGWNGRFNGSPIEPGTYVYMIRIGFTDGTTELYKGTVTVIR